MQKTYTLTIENTLKQKVTKSWSHAPCISDVVEAVDATKYMLDSPTLIHLELTGAKDIDAYDDTVKIRKTKNDRY